VLTLAMVSTIAVSLLRLGASELLPRARPAALVGAPAALARVPAAPPDVPAVDAAAHRDTHLATHLAAKAAAHPAASVPTSAAAPLLTDLLPADIPPVEAPSAPDPADDRLAIALDHAMRQHRLYRGDNLTIASLAAQLAVPEYRLRRVINQRLGHRNFNAFVNAWRLQDTYDALADPGLRDRPVLTIALEAGFQSIGPFNRAFKAATGLTPSEFRQQKLADS